MEKEQFLSALKEELIRLGLDETATGRHLSELERTLSPEAIRGIEQMDEKAVIPGLAADIFKAAMGENVSVKEDTKAEPSHDAPQKAGRGPAIYWGLMICTLPLTLVLAAVYFTAFGAAFLSIILLAVLFFVIMLGVGAVGASLSLIGIVYGITQLASAFSSAPGLYEIALGMSAGGATILFSLLSYYISVRLSPLLLRLLRRFFSFSCRKIRTLFQKGKEACYKL